MDAMMLDGIAVTDQRPMNALDRCDGCGAQAYVRVTIKSGDLLMCHHHWKKNEDKLIMQALAIRDETDKLLAKP